MLARDTSRAIHVTGIIVIDASSRRRVVRAMQREPRDLPGEKERELYRCTYVRANRRGTEIRREGEGVL